MRVKKETPKYDFVNLNGIVDAREMIAMGIVHHAQSTYNQAYLTVLADIPGVEGLEDVASSNIQFQTLVAPAGAVGTSENVKAENLTYRCVTLNISYEALNNSMFDNDGMSFQCRFNQRVRGVYLPWACMVSIFDNAAKSPTIPVFPMMNHCAFLQIIPPGTAPFSLEHLKAQKDEKNSTVPTLNPVGSIGGSAEDEQAVEAPAESRSNVVGLKRVK